MLVLIHLLVQKGRAPKFRNFKFQVPKMKVPNCTWLTGNSTNFVIDLKLPTLKDFQNFLHIMAEETYH